MELGHWVTGSMGHLSHLSRLGHRVIILTDRQTDRQRDHATSAAIAGIRALSHHPITVSFQA